MLQALAERQIKPDLVFGASVGALNAAWIAGDPNLDDLDGLAAVWTSLRTRDVFPLRPLTGLLGFLGRRNSLVSSAGVRAIVSRHLRFERLEEVADPAVRRHHRGHLGPGGRADEGNALDSIVASASIPGVFPSVKVGEHTLMDGGVVNNTPISNAIDAGRDAHLRACRRVMRATLQRPPRTALGDDVAGDLAARAATSHHRRGRAGAHVDLHVIPPPCPVVGPTDFSHARELIDERRQTAGQWLDTFHRGSPDHFGSAGPAHA